VFCQAGRSSPASSYCLASGNSPTIS
jgi:hypothetical protein